MLFGDVPLGTLPTGVLGRVILAFVASVALAACGAAPRLAGDVRARALGFVESGRTQRGERVWSRQAAVAELRMLEVVVGTDEVEDPLPLVVAVHGYGDTPRVPTGPYLAVSRPYRCVVPEGPAVVGEGRAWSTIRVRDERPDELARDLELAAEQIARLVETVRAVRPTRGPTVLVGYSQGGHVTLALATRRPDLFDVALPMAGWLPPSLEPTGPAGRTVIRAIHARDDERIPYAPSAALIERLRAGGWDARLETIEGTHAVSPGIEEFVRRELSRALVAE